MKPKALIENLKARIKAENPAASEAELKTLYFDALRKPENAEYELADILVHGTFLTPEQTEALISDEPTGKVN
jgi:hypothetical protein